MASCAANLVANHCPLTTETSRAAALANRCECFICLFTANEWHECTTSLGFAADANEGHLIIGTTAVHAAALELVVGGAELAEIAEGTVLCRCCANLWRIGLRVAKRHLTIGAAKGGHLNICKFVH